MQTKNLVERLFHEPSLQKLMRISEYVQKNKKLELERRRDDEKKVDASGKTGSLYIVENP